MGDIVDFTGQTTLDIDPDRILEKAIGQLQEVIVIGIDKDDEYYYAVSSANTPLNVFRALRFIKFLQDAEMYDNDD